MNRNASQEYLLQGSVLDDSVDIILHRLRGMSDYAEESRLRFKEHELIYSIREGSNMGSIVNMRVRKSMLTPDKPPILCYLGHPELGNRPTTVRTCVEVNCSHNVCQFVQDLGFRLDYEFITQGWLFRKSRLKVKVTKVFKILNPPNLDQIMPVSKSHLVEVSTVSNSGDERAATEVQSFAEQLKPLVNLEKKDPRRQDM